MLCANAASALGGTSELGRFFRDLRKLHAAERGRAVGLTEYGIVLGEVLGRPPFDGDEIASFHKGHYITPEILRGALQLILR